MAKNRILKPAVRAAIDGRVERVIERLGHPEPPLDLAVVRDALSLDLQFYRRDDPSLLEHTISKLRVGTRQVIKRPTLLFEAVKKLELRALYLPDSKRILLDQSVPELKHRWSEAHEVLHSLLPWHEGAMLGDDKRTLTLDCHDAIENEANWGAGRLLFLLDRFSDDARDRAPGMASVKELKPLFGNTYTATFWRCVETWGATLPVMGLITGHPHPSRRADDFDARAPCRHFVQSADFSRRFSRVSELDVFDRVAAYCRSSRAGPLGAAEVDLLDDNGDCHRFAFESFCFHYQTLTLGVYQGPTRTFVTT